MPGSCRARFRNGRSTEAGWNAGSEHVGGELTEFFMGVGLDEGGDAVGIGRGFGRKVGVLFEFDPVLFEPLVEVPPGGLDADLVVVRMADQFAEDIDGFRGGVLDDVVAGGAQGGGPALGVHPGPLANGARRPAGQAGHLLPAQALRAGRGGAEQDGVRGWYPRGYGSLGVGECAGGIRRKSGQMPL